MKTTSNFKLISLRILRVLGYVTAFLALPAIVAIVDVMNYAANRNQQAPSYTANLTPPTHDSNKPTVAIVMSNVWTEITDFLGPYEVLTTSEAYNVYSVAPERKLSTLNGVLDVMPHYSFAELEAKGLKPDIIVVPFMNKIYSSANAPVLAWIKKQFEQGSKVLTICAGSEVAAASGILDGRKATTYWTYFDRLEKEYPTTEWIRGLRYVDDGDIMSSAGITSGIDATLHLLEKLNGEALALEVAGKLKYPHTRFLDDPTRPVPTTMADMTPVALYQAFRWDKPTLGVVLYDGVSELELSSILDTYPTAGVANAITLADERKPFTTKHGLYVVPRADLTTAPHLSRLLVPGVNPIVTRGLEMFAAEQGLEIEALHLSFADTAARYPFDAALSDLAKDENKAIAKTASLGLEYPIDHLTLEGRSFPFYLLLRFLGLGVASVLLAVGLSKGVSTLQQTKVSRSAQQSGTMSSVS